ncbi:MAG: hypothetical protein JWN70_3920 [Planctomycetaceae bacterium]|nr:hypothetical protein [Planctomycetaceae bacterium]
MFRKMFIASAFIAITASVAMLSAEAPATAKPTKSADQADSGKRTPDHLLATCVALGNQGEISISEIARTKATNDDVKKFADMMITDHHAFLEKLQKFAPEATKAGYLDSATKEAKTNKSGNKIQQTAATDADKSDVKTADAKSGDGSQHFHHMQLERELATQCLASSKEMLESKSGPEFDACFIGMQLGMHMHMKDKLIVFQRHVSPELAAIFAEGQKTTEEHMAKAEKIMKDLHHTTTTRTVETKRGDGKGKERKVTKEAN